MRQHYKQSYRYRLTNPPKALLKARMDNIAIVPASLLGLKALWQTAANTLPQGGVLLCHSQQNTRQRKLPDFSVVLFRPNFMLVSEEYLMKSHKNQWFLPLLSLPELPHGGTNPGTFPGA
jgi:hypothetical protein